MKVKRFDGERWVDYDWAELRWAAFILLGVLAVFLLLWRAAASTDRLMATDDCVREKLEQNGLPYGEANWNRFAPECR